MVEDASLWVKRMRNGRYPSVMVHSRVRVFDMKVMRREVLSKVGS
jgi:hypothetical protein